MTAQSRLGCHFLAQMLDMTLVESRVFPLVNPTSMIITELQQQSGVVVLIYEPPKGMAVTAAAARERENFLPTNYWVAASRV